jgi:hypothetical protein
VALAPFVKDSPPRVTVSAPVRGAVARPNLRIDVDCVDDGPAGCTSVTVYAQNLEGQVIASGVTSVHTTVSLASFDGQSVLIFAWATDSHGPGFYVGDPYRIYVESSAALVALDSAGARVMDADSSRLLYVEDGDTAVKIHDRVGGTTTLLATQAPPWCPCPWDGYRGEPWCDCPYGYLHPQGAIWVNGSDALFDWRARALADLGSVTSLAVAGDWAAWSASGLLKRRDLANGATTTLAREFAYNPSVAPNGDVAWDYASHDIWRYHGGTSTQLTATVGTDYWLLTPVTDGTNVLFLKQNAVADSHDPLYTIALAKDGNVSDISARSRLNVTYRHSYHANAGWIAYLWPDGAGLLQVRARSPLGDDVQVTHAAADCRILALASDGTLAYACGLLGVTPVPTIEVLRAPYTGTPTTVGHDLADAQIIKFRGTELIYLLGNTAFHVNY